MNLRVLLWTDPARSVGSLRAGGRFNWSVIVQQRLTVWIRVARWKASSWSTLDLSQAFDSVNLERVKLTKPGIGLEDMPQ